MYPKKFSLSFILLYLLCDISISISLFVALSTTLWNTHIVSVFLFSPRLLLFLYLWLCLWVCLRVCVIYIISLLQKFTLIVGTIFWHFGFTTLRAVCVAVAVAVDVVVAVFDNFFVVVQPYVKLVSLFLPLALCVCLPHPIPRFLFNNPQRTSPALPLATCALSVGLSVLFFSPSYPPCPAFIKRSFSYWIYRLFLFAFHALNRC